MSYNTVVMTLVVLRGEMGLQKACFRKTRCGTPVSGTQLLFLFTFEINFIEV